MNPRRIPGEWGGGCLKTGEVASTTPGSGPSFPRVQPGSGPDFPAENPHRGRTIPAADSCGAAVPAADPQLTATARA